MDTDKGTDCAGNNSIIKTMHKTTSIEARDQISQALSPFFFVGEEPGYKAIDIVSSALWCQ